LFLILSKVVDKAQQALRTMKLLLVCSMLLPAAYTAPLNEFVGDLVLEYDLFN
jgi:hypothetical protein